MYMLHNITADRDNHLYLTSPHMPVNGGRKPEHPAQTDIGTGRTCKRHPEMSQTSLRVNPTQGLFAVRRFPPDIY